MELKWTRTRTARYAADQGVWIVEDDGPVAGCGDAGGDWVPWGSPMYDQDLSSIIQVWRRRDAEGRQTGRGGCRNLAGAAEAPGDVAARAALTDDF